MSTKFAGKVIRGARVSPVNAATTGEVNAGVVRGISKTRSLDPYLFEGDSYPIFTDASADQYRVASLDAPGTTPIEYLVWVANSGKLAYSTDNDWWIDTGTYTVVPNTLVVGTYTDGSLAVRVTNNESKLLDHVISLVVARGDVHDYNDEGWVDPDDPSLGRNGTKPYLYFLQTDNPTSTNNTFKITDSADITSLGGGISSERGDQIIQVQYVLAPATFWWSRNDRYQTRFGWNATALRWEPFKGGSPKNLGPLMLGLKYQMYPRIANLPIGAYLSGIGNPTFSDTFSVFRLGSNPSAASSIGIGDEQSYGSFKGIQVFADNMLDSDFDFGPYPELSGVMGQFNGKLQFNPAYVKLHAGKTLWYYYRNFDRKSDGIVGSMLGADSQPLFLSPLPDPMGCPLIRFGNRKYLTVQLVSNDQTLLNTFPTQGSAVVSMTTGQIRFNPNDIALANPNSALFDKQYLSNDVIYDGVALNSVPQPLRPSRIITDSIDAGSSMYLGNAFFLPEEGAFTSPSQGLGKSGVLEVPDGTGSIPNGFDGFDTYQAASVRPEGDKVDEINTGLIRQIDDGIGDTIVFTRQGAFPNLHTVDFQDAIVQDFPNQDLIPFGDVYIAKNNYGVVGNYLGSPVEIGTEARQQLEGEKLYFLQASLTPAYSMIYPPTYTKPKLYSRNRDIFRFKYGANEAECDTLYVGLFDGSTFIVRTWSSYYLWDDVPWKPFYTAEEVKDNFDLIVGNQWLCTVENGYLVLSPQSGNIAIGILWNNLPTDPIDLSGATALGFIPGWWAATNPYEPCTSWLPDSGISFGFFRNPANLDSTLPIPDVQNEIRITDEVLQNSVSGTPYVFLDHVPLQDVPGYDYGVYFSQSLVATQEDEDALLVQKYLIQCEDVIYRFDQKKFDWIEASSSKARIEKATSTIAFGKTAIVPESFYGNPQISKGLYVTEDGGTLQFQTLDTDFILPQGGTTGTAILTETYGAYVTFGAQGIVIQGSDLLTDTSVDFLDVTHPIQAGYRIDIDNTGISGSYIVLQVITNHQLQLNIPVAATPDTPVVWRAYTGYPDSVYDPSLVADMIYKEFNHLLTEPFKVRMLSSVGVLPATETTPTLKANVAEALASGRPINIRYGLVQATAFNTAQMVALTKTSLGTIANNVLVIPNTTNARFTTGSFSLQLGADTFTHASGKLVGVTAFSTDPYDHIEYLISPWNTYATGTIRFGSLILTQYNSADVLYVEEFQPATDVPALTVEFSPITGYLNFSQEDMDAFNGIKAYFVQQMITEGRKDVAISPLLGAFSFSTPVPTGAAIEVEYWMADLSGAKVEPQITEFLPVFVRNEVAVKVGPNSYTFNAAKRTVDQRIEPIVTVGAVQQNFGRTDFVVAYPPELNGLGCITFTAQTFPDYQQVVVNYAVWEALGGERGYESSLKPVYRPPFFITAGQKRFGLRGDRANEFVAGQMLRIGEDCFYIQKTQYYPYDGTEQSNITGIYIYPPTVNEVGSRAPGNDIITVVSAEPVTTQVPNPDDPLNPILTTAPAGFMSTIDLTVFPFQPVSKGQRNIVFQGDLMQFAVPGNLLEVANCPFTIAESKLSDDGMYTSISVTSTFQQNFTVADNPTIKLSYRPVYPPQPRKFIGCGPTLDTEPVTLILYSEGIPGQTLTPNTDYKIDYTTGNIELLSPMQNALQPYQKLILSFTKQATLQPFILNGAVICPRISAEFLNGIIPDDVNGVLGSTLSGTYTYRNPDTYYVAIPTMKQYVGEVTQQAVQEMQASKAANGPVRTTSSSKNWDQGRIGLIAQRQDLCDKDWAARRILDFYNSTIVYFEQIEEAITGGYIGDRDGKFRFWIGYGMQYPAPGYEDSISGNLITRNLFSEVFSSQSGIWFIYQTTDPLIDPATAYLNDELIYAPSGILADVKNITINLEQLDPLMYAQASLVRNDIDDLLLTGAGEPVLESVFYNNSHITNLNLYGVYKHMFEPQQFSRLFPTQTESFSMTFPGIGAVPPSNVGFYSAGRMYNGKLRSTTGKPIGQLKNPVVGDIKNVSTADLSQRRARARIWGYFPNGIEAGKFYTDDTPPLPSPAILEPCVIAFPCNLGDVPINPETGFPDQYQLLTSTGTVPDANKGDPSMFVPGFTAGSEVSWGQPDGSIYPAVTARVYDTRYMGLFVKEVKYGCVILFKNDQGTAVVAPNNVCVSITDTTSIQADNFPIRQGDTIFEVPSLLKEITPPISTEDQAKVLPGYRNGFDLLVQSDGKIIDTTFPSKYDTTPNNPLAPKELLGQNPPLPMSYIGGEINFFYDSAKPLHIPALDGSDKDDSGDYQIPYMATGNSEYKCLSVMPEFLSLSTILSPMPIIEFEDYPQEILAIDGWVVDTYASPTEIPATLMTSVNEEPAAPLKGADKFDLLFVQSEAPSKFSNGVPVRGPQGIWTIGDVSYDAANEVSLIEPPRFVTQTTPPIAPPLPNTGSPVGYTIENAMVFVDGEHSSDDGHPQSHLPLAGVKLVYYPNYAPTGRPTTILDFSSVPDFSLNNGLLSGVGNLNNIYLSDSDNTIKIKLIARWDDDILNYPPPPETPPYPWQQPGGEVVLTFTIKGTGTLTVEVEDWAGRFYNGVIINPVQFGVSYPIVVNPADNKQIIIDAYFPIWGVGTPPTNAWFLPYSVSGVGPTEKWETLYGFEYSFDIEAVASDTAWIDTDRLTFHETIDLRHAKERGYTYPTSGLLLETGLVVNTVSVGYNTGVISESSINKWVNGWFNFLWFHIPYPFTFKPRELVANHSAGGNWSAETILLSEEGSLKVMAFEGYNNTSITATNAEFSVAPSVSSRNSLAICSGTGETESYFNPSVAVTNNCRNLDSTIQNITVASGSLNRVQKGDTLVISQSADATNIASTKVGTYIVRHAIKSSTANYYECIRTTITGSNTDWCPIHFPTVVDATVNTPTSVDVILTDLAPVFNGSGFVVGQRLYIIRGDDFSDNAQITNTVTSGEITNIDVLTSTLTVTDFTDGAGTSILATTFRDIAQASTYVTGMSYVPVNVSCNSYAITEYDPNLPSNNCVGLHDTLSTGSIFGFHQIILTRKGANTFTVGGSDNIYPVSTPATGVGVGALEANLNEHNFSYNFKSNPQDPIYSHVPYLLDLTQITTDQWKQINTDSGLLTLAVPCILPSTTMECIFRAKEGVFLEPSMPRTCMDLNYTKPLVVYNGNFLPDPDTTYYDYERYIGMRSANAYDTGAVIPANTPEKVSFTVKSIRRFHEVLENGLSEIEPLRYVYEIRRGIMNSFSADADSQITTVTANGFYMNWYASYPKPADVWYDGTGPHYGTNLGPFTSSDVNVKAGDTFRRLDEDGNVIEERIIKEVMNAYTITLNPPVLVEPFDAANSRFEIYIQNSPVPHEQSNEQLLGMLTDKLVLQSNAHYSDKTGGYVKATGIYADDVNKLYDDSNTSTFSALGVAAGDIVLIDPAGWLPPPTGQTALHPPERGFRPIGDQSVPDRSTPPYVAGHPKVLDDNRGYYRVQSVVNTPETYLQINPVNTFAGTFDDPVIFGGNGYEYTVYPTVSSTTPPYQEEGQMDLRPTASWDIINRTYANDGYSVRPFSYKIIRPSKLFSDQAIDVILSTRERMLTWIEMINIFLLGWKSGSYFIFQRDKHIENLGNPDNPELGLGVPSDELLADMTGLVWNAPYANNSGCMSLLDRRFWIGDERLDWLTSDPTNPTKMRKWPAVPPSDPYTAFNSDPSPDRPILLDWINEILNKKDKFRDSRYIWVNYRTNKVYGTLSQIQQYDIALPKKRQEEKDLATLMATVDKLNE